MYWRFTIQFYCGNFTRFVIDNVEKGSHFSIGEMIAKVFLSFIFNYITSRLYSQRGVGRAREALPLRFEATLIGKLKNDRLPAHSLKYTENGEGCNFEPRTG